MPSILFGLYIVPLLASVAVGQSTGTCLSSASSGNANYQACCATLGAQDVETIDTVSFRYTCNAYMNDFDTPATVANSAAECARRCINSDDCVASSWESGTSQCYLSPDRPGLATRVDAAYGVGWLALEQTTPFDLDTACQSRVDSEAVRAEAACQSRIDAAVAPLQKRLLQSTGFIEGTYIEADHTDKDINSIPVSQAQTVTVDGETWKVYYFQQMCREHAANLVTLADESRCMVDVGYGGVGPELSSPLVAGPVSRNTALESCYSLERPLFSPRDSALDV
ncbi:hypothetical protein BDV25DRAFT_146123 [Aspergillus avenaceus]|uniref:Apple domain-containing protein n=1 Tax=Aspergillus avenaceus TaxID=36643 RepID=A0A5N6TD64_ASPAV|nr:hypothetical protein BDV25DRAFT_146123 [Aspergillus avenaceus]